MEFLGQSKYFSIKQCDLKRCFCFETEEKSVPLSFCQLIDLRDKVRSIDIETHFDADQNKHGIEILCFCNRKHLIILDTFQVIDLKTCIATTFTFLRNANILALAR